jgi:type VI secretion system protein ImpH
MLRFPGATLDEAGPSYKGRMRVKSNFLGLTGPMGALPLHVTEFAQYEDIYAEKTPFGDFLDILTSRFLQFFYRAWGDSQPAVHADQPEDDRYARYLAALSGALEAEAPSADLAPRESRLEYLSLYLTRRDAGAIGDGLSRMLRTHVRVQEFIVQWRDIDPGDQTRLGAGGGFNGLGSDTYCGSTVCDIESTIRVVVNCEDYAAYQSYLPGSLNYTRAVDGLNNLVPSHIDWEIELEIDQSHLPALALDGTAPLGWASWLAPPKTTGTRADLRLHASHI